jgi:hypothetical protein
MHATMLLPEYDHLGTISTTDVEKVFQQCNLWAGERKPKVKLPNWCQYEANCTNLIWHTDLQYFHHDGWTIAWIDDRSRMCLGFKFSPEQELGGDSGGTLRCITTILCSLFSLQG